MEIISPVDDLATSHPLAADVAARASQPPASNPVPESLLDDQHGGTTAAAAYVVAGTTAWSSHPPPYASTPTTSGGFNPTSSTTPLSRSMMDTYYPQAPPARIMQPAMMAETSFYYHPPQTQLPFPQCFTPAAFAQGVIPPPVLVPMQTTPPVLVQMQTTSVEPSYYRQTQGAADSATAEAVIAHEVVPDTHKAQEPTTPAPRRRGRPRKTDTATAAAKPVFKPPPKHRAAARSNRAASPRTASVADPATMAGQVHQVQHPEHAVSVFAVSTADHQTAPCTNPMALLCQEQWQLQSTYSNSLSTGDDQSTYSNSPSTGDNQAAVVGQEVMMGPYADTSAPGVRFNPTDKELIFYLMLKHAGVQKMPVDFFKDVDVYHVHPETTKALCGESLSGFWYAFSPRNRKYKNGERPARSVFAASGKQVGFWKSNTRLTSVFAGGKDNDDGALIGKVTSLTFHLGPQPNGTKTPWKMKEYAIPEKQHAPDGSAMRLNDWVVCKLFYKERQVVAPRQEDELGDEDVSRAAGGDEGMTQMVPTDQTLGSSEQDLHAEDDYLVYDETFAQQNHAANCNMLHRQA